MVAFERQAEVCQEHLAKGRMIAVQGRLDFNRWNGPDGKQRSVHSVIADRVEFLSGDPRPPQLQAEQPQAGAQEPAHAGYRHE